MINPESFHVYYSAKAQSHSTHRFVICLSFPPHTLFNGHIIFHWVATCFDFLVLGMDAASDFGLTQSVLHRYPCTLLPTDRPLGSMFIWPAVHGFEVLGMHLQSAPTRGCALHFPHPPGRAKVPTPSSPQILESPSLKVTSSLQVKHVLHTFWIFSLKG